MPLNCLLLEDILDSFENRDSLRLLDPAQGGAAEKAVADDADILFAEVVVRSSVHAHGSVLKAPGSLRERVRLSKSVQTQQTSQPQMPQSQARRAATGAASSEHAQATGAASSHRCRSHRRSEHAQHARAGIMIILF